MKEDLLKKVLVNLMKGLEVYMCTFRKAHKYSFYITSRTFGTEERNYVLEIKRFEIAQHFLHIVDENVVQPPGGHR